MSGSSDCAASALVCALSSVSAYPSAARDRCCSIAAEPASAAAFSQDDIATIIAEPRTIADEERCRLAARAHMRHQPHQEGPEGVDADRDRGRIDEGAEEDDGRRAVEQIAHAEIGVDAGARAPAPPASSSAVSSRASTPSRNGRAMLLSQARHSPASLQPPQEHHGGLQQAFQSRGRSIRTRQPETAQASLSPLSAFASGDGAVLHPATG